MITRLQLLIGPAIVAVPLALASPADAAASTVAVAPDNVDGEFFGSVMTFRAAPATVNVVTISTQADGRVRVVDTAGVTAGVGCQQVTAQEALCSPINAAGALSPPADVRLGDLDDHAVVDIAGAVVRGETGVDALNGSGTASVRLSGGPGNDQLNGADGNDSLFGEAGDDVLNGGSGIDGLNGGVGTDRIDGAAGPDTVSYSGRTENVSVDLADPAGDGATGENDVLVAIENVTGLGNDLLRGDSGANVIDAGTGRDTLEGRDGDDRLNGGPDSDHLTGGRGNDVIVGDGNNFAQGEPGRADVVHYNERTSGVRVTLSVPVGSAFSTGNGESGESDAIDDGVENVAGGLGDDEIIGDGGINTLGSFGGRDTVRGLGNDDLLIAASGILDGGIGTDRCVLGGSGVRVGCES